MRELTFVANLEVLLIGVVITAFIATYAVWAPGWRDTPVGRMLMGLAGAMWFLVTLAFTARWLPISDFAFAVLAVVVYGGILLSWVWALAVMIMLVRRIITPNRMDPHPVRDWFRRRRQRKAERHE